MSREKESLLVLAGAYLEESKKLVMENKVRDAEKLVLRAKELYEHENDEVKYIETLNVLGVIYNAMDDDSDSITCYIEGLSCAKKILRKIEDTKSDEYCNMCNMIATLYNNIGSRYEENEAYDKAIECFKKAEEYFKSTNAESDIITRRRAFIIYLNFTECYGQLDLFEEAWESLKRAKDNMVYDEDGSENFSYVLLEYKLRAVSGEREYVKSKVDMLVTAFKNHHDATDYMHNMRSLCDLLCWINEYDAVKEVLEYVETKKDDWNSIAYDMLIIELWMNYYTALGDEDMHLLMCKEYAYLSLAQRKSNHKNRAEVIDIRLEFQKNEEQRRLATKNSYTDSLTGIGNRAKLNHDAKKLIDELIQTRKSLGIGIIDVDFFKQQNDTYGHLQGDECLKAIADIIKESLHQSGEVYRFGGDEFILIIRDAKKHNIKKIAESIKIKLHEKAIPNINSKVMDEVTVSQGYVCMYPRSGDSIESLMDIADKSLYNVKQSGRNSYFII